LVTTRNVCCRATAVGSPGNVRESGEGAWFLSHSINPSARPRRGAAPCERDGAMDPPTTPLVMEGEGNKGGVKKAKRDGKKRVQCFNTQYCSRTSCIADAFFSRVKIVHKQDILLGVIPIWLHGDSCTYYRNKLTISSTFDPCLRRNLTRCFCPRKVIKNKKFRYCIGKNQQFSSV